VHENRDFKSYSAPINTKLTSLVKGLPDSPQPRYQSNAMRLRREREGSSPSNRDQYGGHGNPPKSRHPWHQKAPTKLEDVPKCLCYPATLSEIKANGIVVEETIIEEHVRFRRGFSGWALMRYKAQQLSPHLVPKTLSDTHTGYHFRNIIYVH